MNELDILQLPQADYSQKLGQNIQAKNHDEKRLREVASEFEALFVKQILDSMRATLSPENRLVDGGMSEEIFTDMLYDEYAKNMGKTRSFGIAEMIVKQFSLG